MVRKTIGRIAPHADGREEFGSMLRRAYPLRLRSFEGLDEYFGASGPEHRMEEPQQANILGFR